MTKKICPRCKGNGYFYVKKEVKWPSKEEEIVVVVIKNLSFLFFFPNFSIKYKILSA